MCGGVKGGEFLAPFVSGVFSFFLADSLKATFIYIFQNIFKKTTLKG